MRFLLRLYPREWRCRYGAEMDAMLRQGGRLGPRDAIDLLRGALDARLHPQSRHRLHRRSRLVRRQRRFDVRSLFGIAALVAVRLAADRLPAPAAGPGAFAASVAEIALWGAIVALVLRRTRFPWPLTLATGCALELLLGGGRLSLGSLLPSFLEPFRTIAWAAALLVLAQARRPGRWPGTEPPAGAPVSARPRPDPPQPLEARGRRAS
ncbi:MAG TPA: hypothetical protein VOB72_00645 [Candidatus Dormibacteraeota bacterium]|nr:hypothetical protein [Candidatus Dormibacteraeota bacterium]